MNEDASPFSQPILALAQNIELNRAGWQDRANERLVLGTLWLDGVAASTAEIQKKLRTVCQVSLSVRDLQSVIERLASKDNIVRLSGGRFRIADSAAVEMANEVAAVEHDESAAQDNWLRSLKEQDLKGIPSWDEFRNGVLGPLIQEQGAGAYRVFMGESPEWNRHLLTRFASANVPPGNEKAFHHAVSGFLKSNDAAVRSYLLRCLRAHLTWQAGRLPADVMNKIISNMETKPRFILFLDTNFLFSLLSLHDNPSNDAAHALSQVLKQLPESISVQLYVLPVTCDEAKRALIANKMHCYGLRFPPNLAYAALEADSLSGIVKRYVQKCAEAGQSIDPEDYFGPYLDDLTVILKANGIKLYNTPMDTYSQRQDVVDDIHHIRDRRNSAKRLKSYEQIEHDAILWHVAHDQRSDYVESPIQATYWVVTVDYQLIGFDAYKHRTLHGLPVCIHPTSLVELLAFWVPRSVYLDEAMLEAMRLPFLFEEFDRNAEDLTLRILHTLSRFDNIADLPKEATLDLLVNHALRERLAKKAPGAEDADLVKEALLTVNSELQEVVKETEQARDSAEARYEDATMEAESLRTELAQLSQAKESALQTADNLKAENARLLESAARRRFVIFRLLLVPAFVSGGFVGIGRLLLASAWVAAPWFLGSLLATAGFSLAAVVSATVPKPSREISEWRVLATFRKTMAWFLAAVVVGLTIEVMGSHLSSLLLGN